MPAPDDVGRIAVLLRGVDRPTQEAIAAAFGGRVEPRSVRVETWPYGWVVTGVEREAGMTGVSEMTGLS
jgi:hypothetical protein